MSLVNESFPMATPPRSPRAAQPVPGLRRVGAQSTVEHVGVEIRRALLTGLLPPGKEFSMAELSAQLQVSHVPVREALRQMEPLGIITLRPGRSAMVSPLDPDEIEDVYRLWILICNDVVTRACVRYTEEDLAGIEEALDAFTALPQESEEAFDAHQEFHMRLLRPGASAWDLRLLDILWLVIERAVRMAYHTIAEQSETTDAREVARRDHLPLAETARARDVARLQRELRHHHESHMRLVLAALPAIANGDPC